MHSVGIHSALAIKRQRKWRKEQKKTRERRYSSESGETLSSSCAHKTNRHNHKSKAGAFKSQAVTSIGMLHIGVVVIMFGVFLLCAGILPESGNSSYAFGSKYIWWNEVTCTGLSFFGLGVFLLILNCLISRKEEEDLEDYVRRQLTRSRSGHRLERDIETGVLASRYSRKTVTLAATESKKPETFYCSTIPEIMDISALSTSKISLTITKEGSQGKSYKEDNKVIENQGASVSPEGNDKRYLLNIEAI